MGQKIKLRGPKLFHCFFANIFLESHQFSVELQLEVIFKQKKNPNQASKMQHNEDI